MNKSSAQMKPEDFLMANKIGSICLTVTTLVLVIIDLFFGISFAPLIILLMSSRIGSSIYMIKKAPSKKEVLKLIFWLVLLTKSLMSFCTLLASI